MGSLKNQCDKYKCTRRKVNKQHCDPCRIKHNEKSKRSRYKHPNICITRGCFEKRISKLHCGPCRIKHNEKGLKYNVKRISTNIANKDVKKNKTKEIIKVINVFRKENDMKEIKITRRNCLKCEKKFESMGNWNRLCEKCFKSNSTNDIEENYQVW